MHKHILYSLQFSEEAEVVEGTIHVIRNKEFGYVQCGALNVAYQKPRVCTMTLVSGTSFQLSHCQDRPKWDSNPWSLKPGSQDLCLTLHGHQDWYKQDLLCLLKLIIACIHF